MTTVSFGYLVPDLVQEGVHRERLVIERSQFLVSLGHTPDTATAKRFIEQIQREFADATHNCWAFAVGAPGVTTHVGYSDDGEPHGTAGRPMLTVLLHGQVGEVTAVVTRYFGGIKLGTGGLVRAYQHMVKLGLDSLPTREHRIMTRFEVVVEYEHVRMLQRVLPDFQGVFIHEEYAAEATFVVEVPMDMGPNFVACLHELTRGAVLMQEFKESLIPAAIP